MAWARRSTLDAFFTPSVLTSFTGLRIADTGDVCDFKGKCAKWPALRLEHVALRDDLLELMWKSRGLLPDHGLGLASKGSGVGQSRNVNLLPVGICHIIIYVQCICIVT